MKKIVLFLSVLLANYAFCQQSAIDFKMGTWEQAQLLAKQSDKPLFIYIYSPSCHFCKKMEATIFHDQQVTTYYNTTFVNLKLNFEEGQGSELAKKYNIIGYPTYMYFDKEGNLLHISGSEKPAVDFIEDARNTFDPQKAYAALKTRYDKGDRSPDLLYNFTTALGRVSLSDNPIDRVTAEYLQTQTEKDMASKKNLDYIFNQAADFDAPAAPYFFKYYELLSKSYSSPEMAGKTQQIIGLSAGQAGEKRDSTKLSHIIDFLSSSTIKEKDQWIALADVKYKFSVFTNEHSQWIPYANAALSYSRKYARIDNYTGFEAASYLYYFTDSRESLEKAAKVAAITTSAEPSYSNLLRQAQIFHKMKQDSKATAYAKKAIDAAAKTKEDSSEAKDLLTEMNTPPKK